VLFNLIGRPSFWRRPFSLVPGPPPIGNDMDSIRCNTKGLNTAGHQLPNGDGGVRLAQAPITKRDQSACHWAPDQRNTENNRGFRIYVLHPVDNVHHAVAQSCQAQRRAAADQFWRLLCRQAAADGGDSAVPTGRMRHNRACVPPMQPAQTASKLRGARSLPSQLRSQAVPRWDRRRVAATRWCALRIR
jgi:hypothetical protein